MNKKLTVLSVLVLAIAISAYSVAGTFAKYTTTKDEQTDTARVAKWKLNGLVNNFNLFSDSYTNDSSNEIVKGSEDVIAPGTDGKYAFAIDGTFETNFVLDITNTLKIENDVCKNGDTYEACTNDTDKQYSSNGLLYNDLEFVLVSSADESSFDWATVDASNIFKLGDLNDKLVAEFVTGKVYPANYNLSSKSYVLHWRWSLGDESADDTKLGNDATTASAPRVTIGVTVKATQSAETANVAA